MCNELKLENTYTHEIVMKTGQTKYALSNLQNLPGRDIEAIMFVVGNNSGYGVPISPNGVAVASPLAISGCYLTLIGADGQKAILDKYPVIMLSYNVAIQKLQKIAPQPFTFDKSYIQLDSSLVEDGKAIVMMIYFKDLKNC